MCDLSAYQEVTVWLKVSVEYGNKLKVLQSFQALQVHSCSARDSEYENTPQQVLKSAKQMCKHTITVALQL